MTQDRQFEHPKSTFVVLVVLPPRSSKLATTDKKTHQCHPGFHKKQNNHVISISAGKPLPFLRVHIIQHLIQQNNLLLQLVQIRQRLRTIIRFSVRVRTRQRFHQLLSSRKISRSPTSNQFLKFSRLGLTIFFFELFCRF